MMRRFVFLFFAAIFIISYTCVLANANEAKSALKVASDPERAESVTQTIKITKDMKDWIETHFDRNVKGEYLSVSEIKTQKGSFFITILSGNGNVLRKRVMKSGTEAKGILKEINNCDLLINYIDKISGKHQGGINQEIIIAEISTAEPVKTYQNQKVINKTRNRISPTANSSKVSVGNQNNDSFKGTKQTTARMTKAQSGTSQQQSPQNKKPGQTASNDTSEENKDKSLKKARTRTDGIEPEITNTNFPNASGKDEKKVTVCDTLAAHPEDSERITPGVSWNDLNADMAIDACRSGLESDPNSVRLQYQYGRSLHKKGRHVEAMKWYRKVALQRYASAQFALGYMYANGNGVKKDESEAIKWYRKAAEQGFAPAETAVKVAAKTQSAVETAMKFVEDWNSATAQTVGVKEQQKTYTRSEAYTLSGERDVDTGNVKNGRIVMHYGEGIKRMHHVERDLRDNLEYPVLALPGGPPGQVELFIYRLPKGRYGQADLDRGVLANNAIYSYSKEFERNEMPGPVVGL